MKNLNSEKIVVEGTDLLNIPLSLKSVRELLKFLEVLLKYSRKINLTARLDANYISEYHILDCIALLRIIPDTDELVDVGSGAGFPGLIIKIVRPEFKVTLVESRQKRASFLDICAKLLKLKDIFIIEERIEKLFNRIETSLAISRATFPFQKWLSIGSKIIKPDGYLIAMSRDDKKDLKIENLKLIKKDTFLLPFSKEKRTNFLFRKFF